MNRWTPFEWIAALRFLRDGAARYRLDHHAAVFKGDCARVQEALERLPAIDRQKHCTAQSQTTRQHGPVTQRLRHAEHARRDQHRIGHRAKRHHAAHMLTPQALAQDKCVLRPNGHDQAQAQKQALGKDRAHAR